MIVFFIDESKESKIAVGRKGRGRNGLRKLVVWELEGEKRIYRGLVINDEKCRDNTRKSLNNE